MASSMNQTHMDDHHHLPSLQNYADIIYQCKKDKNLAQARSIHTQLCQYGIQTEMGNFLVPLFVQCGSISNAEQLFLQLNNRSDHSWNHLIQGYVDCGRLEQAIDAYKSSNMYRDICRVLDSPELVQELWVQVKLFPNKSSIFSLI